EENADRLDFSPSELYFITRARKEREAASAAERRGTRTDLGENFHDVAGKTRDKLGSLGNMSGKSFEKLEEVFDAATESPELYVAATYQPELWGVLEREWHRKRNIDKAFVELRPRKKRNEYRKDGPPPPEGKFETAVVDPAWPMERINLIVAPSPKELDYDTM